MGQDAQIVSLLKDFYRVSGIRVSIHDTEFHEIYSYPRELTPFCRCLQENRAVREDCIRNDAAAFNEVRKTGKVFVYRCKRGLYEAVAPIYHFGVLSGYLMMGQIREDGDQALFHIQQVAMGWLKDRRQATELANGVRAIPRDLIDSYINLMTVIAENLTGQNKLYFFNERLPQLILEYLNQHYASRITLDRLSKKFGCCNSTLTKCFQNEYGQTIIEKLTDIRVQKAAELLCKSRCSIKEISSDCGFSDQNYFSKVFSSKYGCPPSTYRKEHAHR